MKMPFSIGLIFLSAFYAASYLFMLQPNTMYACAFPRTVNFRVPNYKFSHPVVHAFYWPASSIDQLARPQYWQWYDPDIDGTIDSEQLAAALEAILGSDDSGHVDASSTLDHYENRIIGDLDDMQ